MRAATLIKKLKDLNAAATKGPWEKPFDDGAIGIGNQSLLSIDRDGMAIFEDPVDCELTVTLRNNIDLILQALEGLDHDSDGEA